jgi:flavin-dependent dehydrogenase
MSIQKPDTLIAHGFMGAGDAVAPLGHSSNTIAMLMGKEAAETADSALQRGDVSPRALGTHDHWLQSDLFRGVEFETQLIQTMLSLSDDDLTTICDCFENSNLEPFFIGSPMSQALASIRLLLRYKTLKHWGLVKSLFL